MSWLCSLCQRFLSNVLGQGQNPKSAAQTPPLVPLSFEQDPLSSSSSSSAPSSSSSSTSTSTSTSSSSSSILEQQKNFLSPCHLLHEHEQSQHQHHHHHHHHHDKCTSQCASPTSSLLNNNNNSTTNNSNNNILIHHHHQTLNTQQEQSITKSKHIHLFDLPDDILHEIVKHATHTHHDSPSCPPHQLVEPRTFKNACSFSLVCRRANELMNQTLDCVSLSSTRQSDYYISRMIRNSGNCLKRLVLRGATRITNTTLFSIAQYCHHLKSIDLSFVSTINDEGIITLCMSVSSTLTVLLLRKCKQLTDYSLIHGISYCTKLDTLDLSFCGDEISDRGLMSIFSSSSRHTLRLVAMANVTRISDATFFTMGEKCTNLNQVCARGLSYITDSGVRALAIGCGHSLQGLDVTLCHRLNRNETLETLMYYCPKISISLSSSDHTHRSLKQIIISSLRQNIFIVHGSDPESGKDTVHTVLIDNGDLVSASLLSSGTTDLSMLGIVLCKSYGSTLSEETKQMLGEDYGIPITALTD